MGVFEKTNKKKKHTKQTWFRAQMRSTPGQGEGKKNTHQAILVSGSLIHSQLKRK